MPKLVDLRGVGFGRLRAIEQARNDGRHAAWFCECLCGGSTGPVRGLDLQIGHTTSCGCARGEAMAATGRANKGRKIA
jgi:hypothetical protein